MYIHSCLCVTEAIQLAGDLELLLYHLFWNEWLLLYNMTFVSFSKCSWHAFAIMHIHNIIMQEMPYHIFLIICSEKVSHFLHITSQLQKFFGDFCMWILWKLIKAGNRKSRAMLLYTNIHAYSLMCYNLSIPLNHFHSDYPIAIKNRVAVIMPIILCIILFRISCNFYALCSKFHAL